MVDVGEEPALDPGVLVVLGAYAGVAELAARGLRRRLLAGSMSAPAGSVSLTIWMKTILLEFGASTFGTKRM